VISWRARVSSQFLLGLFRDIDKIFFVQLRNDNRRNAGTHGGQTFFFQAADGKDEAAQSDFAGHGDIWTHRRVAEK
jgi:hypothetical protein